MGLIRATVVSSGTGSSEVRLSKADGEVSPLPGVEQTGWQLWGLYAIWPSWFILANAKSPNTIGQVKKSLHFCCQH